MARNYRNGALFHSFSRGQHAFQAPSTDFYLSGRAVQTGIERIFFEQDPTFQEVIEDFGKFHYIINIICRCHSDHLLQNDCDYLLPLNMKEKELIDTFLMGINPGFVTIQKWIDAIILAHAWGDKLDAQEIRQEVMSIVYQNLREGKYRGEGLKTYINSICKNNCLMSLRRSYRIKDVSIEDNEICSQDLNPGEQILQKEEYLIFRKVFEKLGFICKRILILKFIHSRSHREIADRLKISEGAARVRLLRCLEKARDLKKGMYNM
jgi:RNA polymerase sigma factor (sigma-70 family)